MGTVRDASILPSRPNGRHGVSHGARRTQTKEGSPPPSRTQAPTTAWIFSANTNRRRSYQSLSLDSPRHPLSRDPNSARFTLPGLRRISFSRASSAMPLSTGFSNNPKPDVSSVRSTSRHTHLPQQRLNRLLHVPLNLVHRLLFFNFPKYLPETSPKVRPPSPSIKESPLNKGNNAVLDFIAKRVTPDHQDRVIHIKLRIDTQQIAIYRDRHITSC